MRTSDMIKSNYIAKAEVRTAGQMTLTIIDCTLEKAGQDDKWVLWFNEHPKGLVLNNTKIRLLEASYGDDSVHWHGRRVRLTYDPTVMMAGQLTGGIKLTCSSAAPGQSVPSNGAYPGTPRPPAPVWDESVQGWVTSELQPKNAAHRPPPPVWDEATQTWKTVDTATGEIKGGPPPTISQRVEASHPNQAPVGSPDNEFGDDIPF